MTPGTTRSVRVASVPRPTRRRRRSAAEDRRHQIHRGSRHDGRGRRGSARLTQSRFVQDGARVLGLAELGADALAELLDLDLNAAQASLAV